jgi:hypothetical protein
MRTALFALALLAGCASAPPPPIEPDPVPTARSADDAPPLGNPRPKLTPDDVTETRS